MKNVVKKPMAVVLVLILLLSTIFSVPFVANAADSKIIKFNPPTGWGSTYKIVYCYLWYLNGSPITAWTGNSARCIKETDGTYSFDVGKTTADFSKPIGLAFVNDLGAQTYDLIIKESCIGDTAVASEETIPVPVDNNKKCYVTRWTKNAATARPVTQFDTDSVFVDLDGVGNIKKPDQITAFTPVSSVLIGDVDYDYTVSIKDATLIQKQIATIVKLNEPALSIADADSDGSVGIADVTAIQKFIAQIKTENNIIGEYGVSK